MINDYNYIYKGVLMVLMFILVIAVIASASKYLNI